jgi:hypothetical protein
MPTINEDAIGEEEIDLAPDGWQKLYLKADAGYQGFWGQGGNTYSKRWEDFLQGRDPFQ